MESQEHQQDEAPDGGSSASSNSRYGDNDTEQDKKTTLSFSNNAITNNHNATQRATASALIIAAGDKAGIPDKESDLRSRIDAIILRESANTKYLEQQRRRDDKVNDRIKAMKQKLQQQENDHGFQLTLQRLQHDLDEQAHQLLEHRRTRSTCVVCDLDQFFIACHMVQLPHLRDIPCCVGGNMISTANYCARKYGVRSALAGWIGDKLVEELSQGRETLVHVKSDFALYKRQSNVVKRVMSEYDPKHLRMGSLDEAYLDLAPYLSLLLTHPTWSHEQISKMLQSAGNATTSNNIGEQAGPQHSHKDGENADLFLDVYNSAEEVLQRFSVQECLEVASETLSQMRQRIFDATGGLSCSAGLAPNYTLAKIASDINKPNGQKIVGPNLQEDVFSFVRPLPTRKMPGIGRVTQKILEAFGISTVQDLHDNRALVALLFAPKTSQFLLRASLGGFGGASWADGDDDEDDSNNIGRKGISRERTFSSDNNWHELNSKLQDIAQKLAQDMDRKQIAAHTITLKVKFDNFDVKSRSRSMPNAVSIHQAKDLFDHASDMLRELRNEHTKSSFSLRLMGIRGSNLAEQNGTLSGSQAILKSFLQNKLSTEPAADEDEMKVPSFTTKINVEEKLLSRKSCAGKAGSSQAIMRAFLTKSPQSKPIESVNATQLTQPYSNNISQAFQPTGHTSSDAVVAKSPNPRQTCPICNKVILFQDNVALNRHIDLCLSGPLIRKAVEEETHQAIGAKPKRQCLRDFFV